MEEDETTNPSAFIKQPVNKSITNLKYSIFKTNPKKKKRDRMLVDESSKSRPIKKKKTKNEHYQI